MNKKLALAVVIACLIGMYFFFDLGRFLNLDYLKSQQAAISAYRAASPVSACFLYFVVYVISVTLSFPGAVILTLAAGAIFGLGWGTLLVSFASSIGATLAFLASRLLFRDFIQGRYGARLGVINKGVEKEGGFYLFTLRLVPAFPFFAINLLMGLTAIRTWTFYWVSQLGMLAGTLVYVNAGTQLAQIDSLRGILSPGLIGSLVLLGVFPLIAKKIVDVVKARRVYARWAHLKPKRFDRNLIVIGAGSAGLVTSYIAAVVRAKVTLVEKHKMGGDCLNTGCVPSKALIKTAAVLAQIRRAAEYGIAGASARVDFADVMARVRRVVSTVEPHDSVARYTELGVECIQGEARMVSPWEVEIRGADGTSRRLTTRAIVIAAGARPFVPPIPGIDQVGCLTSDTVWDMAALPARMVVLGGGPIGCELAQSFARLGAKVTQVEMLPRLMMREDPEFSAMVAAKFGKEGIDVLLGHKAVRFAIEDDEKVLYADHDGREVRVAFDALLCAVGRVANTTGYGLQELGIAVTASRTVEVDEYMRTVYPNILACGDVAGPYQFTHMAAHTAWYASVNGLFGMFRTFRADFSVVPWATFTDPEVARVGLNETEAIEKGVPYEVTTFGIDDLDRAITDEAAHGLVKVLTVPGKDRVLGVTIAGAHAGDLIAEYVLAMRHGLGLNKILGTIHIYPTMAEANKYVAGNWKRNHAPQKLLAWAGRFNTWRRG